MIVAQSICDVIDCYVLRFMRHAPLKILHSYGDITIVSEGQQH